MASPDKHSRLGPSGAERWIHCPPSVALTESMPDEQTVFAAEGTAAHALAEYKVCCALHLPHEKRPASDFTSDEMEECTDDYCRYVCDLAETEMTEGRHPLVLVEEHVDFDAYVPGGFGRCDFLLVSEGRLHIVDFKYGRGVVVQAEKNAQMMLYALGAYLKYDCVYEIQEITMTIFQPRIQNISTWTTTAKELQDWAENVVKPAAQKACKGLGEYQAGPWCRFCLARATCRARAQHNLSLAKHEFRSPDLLTDTEIVEVLAKADELKRWCEDVYAYAQNAAASEGRHFEGFKLVRGRSTRKFLDPDLAEKAAKEAGFTDIYRTSLITLTGFEKLMGKDRFREILGPYVTREEGKLSLVPASDKRPEVNTDNANQDFMED